VNKDLKRLVKTAEDRGWYVHRVSKHLILRHPGGGQVVASLTPGGANRSRENLLAQLKRAERQAGTVT
jgi:predicted RNA binding protein YcfA (HicA-like mRNA interferase family)